MDFLPLIRRSNLDTKTMTPPKKLDAQTANHGLQQPIDSNFAKSLSEKSDQELVGILENPADWRPEVIDFARSELARRAASPAQVVSPAQTEQKLEEDTKKTDEERQKRSSLPLSFWESVFTAFYGAGLGLLGLFFVWARSSRFKSNGYTLKSKKSWQLYWFAFGVRLAVVAILVIIAVSRGVKF